MRWTKRRAAVTTDPLQRPFPRACTPDDVYHCFRLLLGRPPSATEWPGHQAFVGREIEQVVRTYLSSREFKNRNLLAAPTDDYVLLDLADFQLYVPAQDVVVGAPLLHHKTYEPHVSAAIRATLRPGMTFVDIGANIGFFTMLGAHLVGPTGRVFAFEPYQLNVKLLFLSAQLNGYAHVRVFPFAASNAEGLLAFDNVGSNGHVTAPLPDLSSVLVTTLVYAAKLDAVLHDVAHVDAIKIDVEGGEYRALQSGRELLARSRPVIFSEFSPPALAALSAVDGETYLRLLLIDQHYVIDTLAVDGSVTECGRDVGGVMRAFEESGIDHIDIVARPTARTF
jgi:FkbM family methyltransferase